MLRRQLSTQQSVITFCEIDMTNFDTVYCRWGVSNFARVATLYFVRNNLGFSVFAGVRFRLSA